MVTSFQFRLILLCAFAALPQTSSASVLERVLQLLDTAFPQITALNISANIAENISNPTTQNRSLAAGDSVIIGYDALGLAILGTADDFGVLVTPSDAAALGSGLSAGLYPVGSALYAIPPAGQLSIFNQTARGTLLDQARISYMTRIDGSITTIIGTMYPPEISQVAALEAGANFFDLGSIGSTALGAVNAGEIVTKVQVVVGPDALGLSGIDMARLSKGPNITFDFASTDITSVLSSHFRQLGGSADASMMAINLATNSTDVTGRVTNIISGVNAHVDSIVTTALGAVNSGSVSN
ncbi:hypothetical protein ACEN2J_20005 [Pseudorhodobacter sp. W20_MBD10_FR17]|uniref:hypothetical protein n=1 Tax=Pseudorhodobacter sp. W20_MBD10_FR17 TaxID=3240266 RepID=UPI003F993D68